MQPACQQAQAKLLFARYYGSSINRFLTVDPGFAGSTQAEPLSWNAYTVTKNNPINHVDPDGMAARPVHLRMTAAAWPRFDALLQKSLPNGVRAVDNAYGVIPCCGGALQPWLHFGGQARIDRLTAKAALAEVKGHPYRAFSLISKAIHLAQDREFHRESAGGEKVGPMEHGIKTVIDALTGSCTDPDCTDAAAKENAGIEVTKQLRALYGALKTAIGQYLEAKREQEQERWQNGGSLDMAQHPHSGGPVIPIGNNKVMVDGVDASAPR